MIKVVAEGEKWTLSSPKVGALSFQLQVISFLPAGAAYCLLQPVLRQSFRPSGFCLAPVRMGECNAVLAFSKGTETPKSELIKRTEGEKTPCVKSTWKSSERSQGE